MYMNNFRFGQNKSAKIEARILIKTVSGHFPPRHFPPGHFPPDTCPPQLPPVGQIPPVTHTPQSDTPSQIPPVTLTPRSDAPRPRIVALNQNRRKHEYYFSKLNDHMTKKTNTPRLKKVSQL